MMIRKITALLVFVLIITSCGVKMIHSKSYNYKEGVDFNVKMAIDERKAYKGDLYDTIYVAIGNGSFKTLVLQFSNTSENDMEINFKEFILLDKSGNKYTPVAAAQEFIPITSVEKFTHILKAGKIRNFHIQYWPPFPKSEPIEKMMVKDVPILIEKYHLIRNAPF